VYRTYARPGDPPSVSADDRAQVRETLARAMDRRPDADPELLAFLGRILLLEVDGDGTAELVWRLQQPAGPVAAEGVGEPAGHRCAARVGASPISAWRASADMETAAREAKTRTSWLAPAPGFEEALKSFVVGVLGDPEFTGDLERFIEPVVELVYANSLA